VLYVHTITPILPRDVELVTDVNSRYLDVTGGTACHSPGCHTLDTHRLCSAQNGDDVMPRAAALFAILTRVSPTCV